MRILQRDWRAPGLLLACLLGGAGHGWAASFTAVEAGLNGGGGRSASERFTTDTSISGEGGWQQSISGHWGFRGGSIGRLNDPPLAQDDLFPKRPGRPAKIAVAELLANDADPEGALLRLVQVGPLSANGVSVSLDGSWVIYSSSASPVTRDQIEYVVMDAQGAPSRGTIWVHSAAPDSTPTLNILRVEILSDGGARILFVGIPGRAYQIEATATLLNPSWEALSEAVAGVHGVYEFVDTARGQFPTRFYRAVQL